MHSRGGPPGQEGAWGDELAAPIKRRRREQPQQAPAMALPAAAEGGGIRVRRDLELDSVKGCMPDGNRAVPWAEQ